MYLVSETVYKTELRTSGFPIRIVVCFVNSSHLAIPWINLQRFSKCIVKLDKSNSSSSLEFPSSTLTNDCYGLIKQTTPLKDKFNTK